MTGAAVCNKVQWQVSRLIKFSSCMPLYNLLQSLQQHSSRYHDKHTLQCTAQQAVAMFSSLLTRRAVHCTRVNASVPVLGHLLLTSGSAATQQQPSYGHCSRHHAWQQHEQHQQQHSYPQQQHQLQRRWICSSQDTCSDSKPPPNTESVNDDGATAAGDGDGGVSDGEGSHHATRTKVTAAGAGGEGYAMVRGHSVPMGALKQDEEQTEGDATEVDASGTPNAAQAAATVAATEVPEGEAAVTATPEKPAGVFGLPAGMARSVAILTTRLGQSPRPKPPLLHILWPTTDTCHCHYCTLGCCHWLLCTHTVNSSLPLALVSSSLSCPCLLLR